VQGTVILLVSISAKRTVSATKPGKLLSYGLDEQAFYTAKNWKFKPATLGDGTPIATTVPVEVTFRLFGE